jgi:hypothetical protein
MKISKLACMRAIPRQQRPVIVHHRSGNRRNKQQRYVPHTAIQQQCHRHSDWQVAGRGFFPQAWDACEDPSSTRNNTRKMTAKISCFCQRCFVPTPGVVRKLSRIALGNLVESCFHGNPPDAARQVLTLPGVAAIRLKRPSATKPFVFMEKRTNRWQDQHLPNLGAPVQFRALSADRSFVLFLPIEVR